MHINDLVRFVWFFIGLHSFQIDSDRFLMKRYNPEATTLPETQNNKIIDIFCGIQYITI